VQSSRISLKSSKPQNFIIAKISSTAVIQVYTNT